MDFDEAVNLYKDALIKSVKRRVRGLRESQVGVIFSGGVDSVLLSQAKLFILKQNDKIHGQKANLRSCKASTGRRTQ